MEKAQATLLQLLRIALWGADSGMVTSAPEWGKVLHLANKQTVLGLVAQAVPFLPKEFQPDKQTCMKLHAFALKVVNSHALLNRKVAELKGRLDAIGVHSVLFKGQGVALNYPNPASRQCGDIDMWVGEKSFSKVHEALKPCSDEDPAKFKHVKHFNVEEDGVEMEIHRIAEILPGVRKDRLFQEWTVRHLEGGDVCKAEIGGASINLPPVQFNALYIMNHAWHHFIVGGIGLRQLCDWAMFLHRHYADVDCDVLHEDLQRFGLERAWQILAGIAVRHLGLPQGECPLYTGKYGKESDLMLDVVWSEGNFGHHPDRKKSPRPPGHFAGKFHSFRNHTSRVARIFRISPADVAVSWISYLVTGMRNLFVRIK